MSNQPPMVPEIDLESSRLAKVCNCCGTEDDTVRRLRFRWTIPAQREGGGTAIALCMSCRCLTRDVLDAERTSAPEATP